MSGDGGMESGGAPTPRRVVPLTQLAFCVLTIIVFVVTQQPLIVLLAVVLGAPLFGPIFDWLTDHSDPWLTRQVRRALPRSLGARLPGVRSSSTRLVSALMVLTILGLVLINYTPVVAAVGHLDDWACSHVEQVPAGACRDGLGTTALTVADGIVRIGVARPGTSVPFDTSQRSAPERAVETRIAANDRTACAAGVPHVTLVVTTALSRTVDDTSLSADEVGIEDLRGSLLAQESYNGEPSHRTKLCLVVANLGNLDTIQNTAAVARVVQQIVLYAKHDPTFVGVVGFPFSSSARQALAALAALDHRDIPIVSPSVTSDRLDGARSFWRIASTDSVQAAALVDYLSWQLAPAPPASPREVVVLIDDNDAYSHSLGNRFLLDVNQELGQWLHASGRSYRVQNAASIAAAVRASSGAAYVMLAGYAYDLGALEVALQSAGSSATILGGDGLYDLERYNDHPFAPVFATGYAPPLGTTLVESQPCPGSFSDAYDRAFGTPVTSTGPQPSITFLGAHAILSYDAVCMYGQALSDLQAAPRPVTRATVAIALQEVSFDGLSGHTTFSDPASPSVPDSKSVYVMCTDRTPTPRLAARVDAARDGRSRVVPGTGATPAMPCPVG